MEAREVLDQAGVLDHALDVAGGNQAELSRRLGVSETTVSRWRNGRNGIDMESALRLARLTGLPARQVVRACGLDPELVPSQPSSEVDSELATVTAHWPTLDRAIRQTIAILVRAGVREPASGRVSAANNGASQHEPSAGDPPERAPQDPLALVYPYAGTLLTPVATRRQIAAV